MLIEDPALPGLRRLAQRGDGRGQERVVQVPPPRAQGAEPDQGEEEQVGLRAGEALDVRPDAARVAPALGLPPLPSAGVGAVEPYAVRGAVDLDAPLGPAAGGADHGPLGRARAAALALGAERAGDRRLPHARRTMFLSSTSTSSADPSRRSTRGWSARSSSLSNASGTALLYLLGRGRPDPCGSDRGWTPVMT